VNGLERHSRLRRDIPMLNRIGPAGKPFIYLDNAATTLTPEPVIAEISRYYRDVSAPVHRGKHMLSDVASTRFERVRAAIAGELSAHHNQVAFVPNTTAALNLVASGLSLTPDDLTLVCLDSHHSLLLPWRRYSAVRVIRADRRGATDLDHYEELLRHRPKLVALTHCSNVTGRYAPVQQMAAMAHDAGALVVLDAAQSVPHGRIRLASLGVDFAAFSAHKMLGPTGLGILYGRLDLLRPPATGGGAVASVDLASDEPRPAPHHLECGTPHIAGVYGLGAAFDYLAGLGWDWIAEHDQRLARVLYKEAEQRPQLRVLGGGNADDRAALLSIELPAGCEADEISQILSDAYGVMCRSGRLCAQPVVDYFASGRAVLRFSAYVYNDEGDIRSAFQALDEVLGVMGCGGSEEPEA
jgi:cysteine desulfurase / selenocysteine lyase